MKHLLLHAGISAQVDCTMLQANALEDGLQKLSVLAQDYLGWNISKDLQMSDWGAAQLTNDQIAYAALDAVMVHRLYMNSAPPGKEALRVARLASAQILAEEVLEIADRDALDREGRPAPSRAPRVAGHALCHRPRVGHVAGIRGSESVVATHYFVVTA
jgi:hypothetical protein